MEDSQAQAATTKKTQGLSVRELLSVMTLVGVTIGMVRFRLWSDHERWLLAAAMGGALVGILASRAARRRIWLMGMLLGTLGGAAATCVIGGEWADELRSYMGPPRGLAERRGEYIAAGAVTIGLGALLARFTTGLFRLLMWLTASGERGAASTLRRQPWRSAKKIAVLCACGLATANFDLVVSPFSWPSEHYIQLDVLEHDDCAKGGILSCEGEWLLVYRCGLHESGVSLRGFQIYRLNPRPVPVAFPEVGQVRDIAFDCDQDNRVAILDSLQQGARLRVVDLETGAVQMVAESLRDLDVESVQWLPGGSIVIHYGAFGDRERYTRFDFRADEWHRQEFEQAVAFDARGGRRLEFHGETLRIVNPANSETVTFDKEWLREMRDGAGFQFVEISPNGRFLLGDRLYDCESGAMSDCIPKESTAFLRGFTNQNLLLHYDYSTTHLHDRGRFLYHVPFVHRVVNWVLREPVRLLDPATGEERARTRPLNHGFTSIAQSLDGSRMAVISDQAVEIFNVPPAFVAKPQQ